MSRLIRTDYQAVNANGVVLFTFNDRDAARAWVRDNACRHDGLCLERIEILAHRDYRPRSPHRRPDAFAVPVMPC